MLHICLIMLLKQGKLTLVIKRIFLCSCVKMDMYIWRPADNLECQPLSSAWVETRYLVSSLHAHWHTGFWEFFWLHLLSNHRSTEITEEHHRIWLLHRFQRVSLRISYLCRKEFTHCTRQFCVNLTQIQSFGKRDSQLRK